jgi:hypothetical protein
MKNSKIQLTQLEYSIQQLWSGTWEEVTTESTFQDAKNQVKCYRDNMPQPVRMVKRRVLKDFSRDFLMQLPTIRQTHSDNVKIETKTYIFLVSRMTLADGANVDNEVTILRKNKSFNWVEISKF